MECTCKGDAVEKGMCALVSSAVVCVHWYQVPWYVCALVSSAVVCVHWYVVPWYVCTGI